MSQTNDHAVPSRPHHHDEHVEQATQQTGQEQYRMPVVEETLTAQKAARQAGEVEIGKHVVEQQVNIPVELSHEEVSVTRQS